MPTTHNGHWLQAERSPRTLPTEIWRWSAVDIAAQVRARTVSCAEVLSAFHKRIDSVNPRLNAIVHADRNRAIETANRADDALRRKSHEVGMLHGVPLTIKLNVDVEGEATTNGNPAYADRVAPADSSVVANLRNAGANIIGRTNVPAFSFRWFTDNPLYGERSTRGAPTSLQAVRAAARRYRWRRACARSRMARTSPGRFAIPRMSTVSSAFVPRRGECRPTIRPSDNASMGFNPCLRRDRWLDRSPMYCSGCVR